MEFTSFEEFKNNDIYEDFMNSNPALGYLKIQIVGASGAIPIKDALVTIYKDIGEENVVFFEGRTNDSGIIENIVLPAPRRDINMDTPTVSLYGLNITHPNYLPIERYSFGIISGIKDIEYIEMSPMVDIETNK
ncbi:MAG: hypothetical protein IJI22_04375 [Bacilli bacterium]|nr:hypothetical protein [Bacilli bacterium]